MSEFDEDQLDYEEEIFPTQQDADVEVREMDQVSVSATSVDTEVFLNYPK